MLHSAFEAVDVVLRAPMKLLQALRTSAKVKDTARILGADSMGCWLFGQAYRAYFQRSGLPKVTLWLINEEVAATGTAKEILDVPEPKRESCNRGDAKPN
ncbi:MAG: hypothetical protein ACREX4_05035 [Gammaproteobacteria bacterium]